MVSTKEGEGMVFNTIAAEFVIEESLNDAGLCILCQKNPLMPFDLM